MLLRRISTSSNKQWLHCTKWQFLINTCIVPSILFIDLFRHTYMSLIQYVKQWLFPSLMCYTQSEVTRVHLSWALTTIKHYYTPIFLSFNIRISKDEKKTMKEWEINVFHSKNHSTHLLLLSLSFSLSPSIPPSLSSSLSFSHSISQIYLFFSL